MIEDYEFGSMTINGKIYTHDLILHGERLLNDNWWREDGHNMTIEDLKDLPESFDVLVIGNGASGVCQVPAETIEYVKNRGADVIVQMTGEAVKTYNRLLSEKKSVAGAFHLTC
ncbi:hypothetical protein JW752_04820 [Candidatus Peregrinibacteria bacterium]|nr:hypothetical protein [Candidatus Peregrinibacteria bacterium]